MNTLFNTTFETEEASHYESAVRLRPRTYDLQESNVHLKLTIVDAVGFGDQINKDERQVLCHLLGVSGRASCLDINCLQFPLQRCRSGCVSAKGVAACSGSGSGDKG